MVEKYEHGAYAIIGLSKMSPEVIKFTNTNVGYCDEHSGHCMCITCGRTGDCMNCPMDQEEHASDDAQGNCPVAIRECEGYV